MTLAVTAGAQVGRKASLKFGRPAAEPIGQFRTLASQARSLGLTWAGGELTWLNFTKPPVSKRIPEAWCSGEDTQFPTLLQTIASAHVLVNLTSFWLVELHFQQSSSRFFSTLYLPTIN